VTISGDAYVWSGALSGNWSTAANWTNSTKGQTPAQSAPGAADSVTVNAAAGGAIQTITGSGASAALTVAGSTLLDGQFAVGTLAVSGSLALQTGDGLTVSSDALIGDASAFAIDGASAALTVGGRLTFGGTGGSLFFIGGSTVTGGARVQAGAVTFDNAYGSPYALSVDDASSFEVGNAHLATVGTITVDAGAQMDLGAGQSYFIQVYAPSVVNYGSIVSSGSGYGNGISATAITNAGAISGVELAASTIANSGTITLTYNNVSGDVTNNGTIVVAAASPHDTSVIYGDVGGSGQIQIATGGQLTTQHVVGNTIVFTGSSGALSISGNSLDGNGAYGAAIQGFGSGDVINFGGVVTSASYANGILTLSNGGAAVAQLSLVGNYLGASFSTISLDGTTTQISLRGGGDTVIAPAGTAGHGFTWSGPVSASWDSAANWTDNSLGQSPAASAPGSKDTVTIESAGAGAIQTISGAGNSASLTVEGNAFLDGHFTTGSLTTTGVLALRAGDSLAVSGPAVVGDGGSLSIDGTDASLTVGGTLIFGGASGSQIVIGSSSITNGGTLQANSLVFNNAYGPFTAPYISLSIDAGSWLEVGNANAATPGTLTVDAGALLDLGAGQTSLTKIYAPNVFNSGSIVSSGTGYANGIWAGTVNNSGIVSNVEIAATAVINAGTLALTNDNSLIGRVSNSGTIVVAGNGSGNIAAIVGDVTGTGQIEIAVDGQLSTQKVNGGGTVAFVGANGVLSLSTASIETNGYYGATILGFGTGDAIQFGGTVTSIAYANGVLTLYNNATAVGALTLAGNYSGANFSLVQQSTYAQIQVTGVTAPVLAGGGTGGTYSGHGQALAIMPNLTMTDGASSTIAAAEVAIASGFQAGDQLGFTAANGITGAYNALTGVLELSGTASLAAYQQVLDSIAFFSTVTDPTHGGSSIGRMITALVYDGSQYSNMLTSTLATAAAPPRAIGDFNGDARSDVLFRSPTGLLASWQVATASTLGGGGNLGDPGADHRYLGSADLNGDGSSDLLFRGRDGTLSAWQMSGTAITGGGTIGNPGGAYTYLDAADFNGDGNADLLFFNSLTGGYASWDMHGTAIVGGGTINSPGSGWLYKATGDFTGDGKSDMLFQDANGTFAIWTLSDTLVIGGGMIANPGPSWFFKGAGDFNGDGKSDLLFENTDGTYASWDLNGSAIIGGGTIGNPGAAWSLAGIGDYDGDGKSDLLFRNVDGTVATWTLDDTVITGGGNLGNPGTGFGVAGAPQATSFGKLLFQHSDGTVASWLTSAGANVGGSTLGNPGTAWNAVAVTDFTGTGESDVLFQGTDGTLAIWKSDGTQLIGGGNIGNPGAGWTFKAAADFNGDGKADVLFQNASGMYATWDVADHSIIGGGNVGTAAGYTFVAAGDMNGDGKADMLFKDASGNFASWFLNDTAIIGGGSIGNPGGTWAFKSLGDFNGDGKTDMLFQDASGMLASWDLDGATIVGGGNIGNPGGSWQLAKVADINQDGKADLVFVDAAGSYATWLMNDTQIMGGTSLGAALGWHLV